VGAAKGSPLYVKKNCQGEQILIAEIDKPKRHDLWHRCWASPNRSPNPQSLNINPNLYLGCGASGKARKLRFEGFGNPGGPKSLNLSFLAPPRGPKSLNLGFLALQNPQKLKYKFIFRFSGPPGEPESIDLKVLAPQGAPKA
jgi:hypothetical protein